MKIKEVKLYEINVNGKTSFLYIAPDITNRMINSMKEI